MSSLRRILIVDDEPDILDSLSTLLSAHSPAWDIRSTTDPVGALSMLEGVDLVMADNRMPGLSGVEFLSRVRDERPEAWRILLTGMSDIEVAIAALEKAQVDYYLRKPWDGAEIVALVSKALDGPSRGVRTL